MSLCSQAPGGAQDPPPRLQETKVRPAGRGTGLTWPLRSETSPRGMRHSGSLACPASSTNTCVKCPTLEPKASEVVSLPVSAPGLGGPAWGGGTHAGPSGARMNPQRQLDSAPDKCSCLERRGGPG